MSWDYSVTAGRLREILKDAMKKLEDYSDETELRLEENAYFLNNYSYVLQIGCRGFLALDGLEEYKENEYEDDEL